MRIFSIFTLFILLQLTLVGCSTIGEKVSDVVPFLDSPVRYSDSPQMSSGAERKYKGMNRSQMEEDAELQAQAGSMWMMEGQTSYLFVPNRARKEGDSVQVKLEGAGQKQVETKVVVIKKLLKQLEEQNRGASMASSTPSEDASRAPASANAANAASPQKPSEDKPDLSDVAVIPAKITEKTPDGLFRVKGTQPLMIDDREFKVIMTGLMKADDFHEEGVSSNKLIDPQYDVVSIRRTGGSFIQ